MSLDADALVDRRKLARKLTLWRVLAVIALIAALAFLLIPRGGDGVAGFGAGDHVARFSIEGLITDSRNLREQIEKAGKSERVKAILLAIDSPGGTTTGSEALYEAVREVAQEKPVVATMGTLAASGGYIAAISADHIVARGNTITGSIGVVFQWAQIAEALDSLGISFEEVKSSPLKAEPSPFTQTSQEARQVMQQMVADSYQWFLGLVAERRDLDAARARALGDGRVYTGRQALEEGLIDAIGGEEEAIAWLAEEHGIDADIKVRDWWPGDSVASLGLVESIVGGVARMVGLESAGLAGLVADSDAARRLSLDGLISVWHAPQDNAE